MAAPMVFPCPPTSPSQRRAYTLAFFKSLPLIQPCNVPRAGTPPLLAEAGQAGSQPNDEDTLQQRLYELVASTDRLLQDNLDYWFRLDWLESEIADHEACLAAAQAAEDLDTIRPPTITPRCPELDMANEQKPAFHHALNLAYEAEAVGLVGPGAAEWRERFICMCASHPHWFKTE